VSNLDYNQQAGIPYCKACFQRHFMDGGARGAVTTFQPGSSEATRERKASASTTDLLANVNLGGGDKCPICDKTVYKAEAVAFQGQSWHKTCFQCGGNGELGCKRNVSNLDYNQSGGIPYCKACFQKNFMEGGARLVTSTTSGTTSDSTGGEAKERTASQVDMNLGGGDKCPICSKSVYKFEAMAFQGQSWHKTCFQCGGNGELGCKRNVSSMDFNQHNGTPYCKACFTHNFMVGNAVAGGSGGDATPSGSGTRSRDRSPQSTRSDNAIAALLGGGDKCPICSKTVYKMEAMAFQSQTWHKNCFACGGDTELGCKRNLSNLDYKQHGGNPYCKACFTHNFMVGNAVSGAVPSTVSTDSGPPSAEKPAAREIEGIGGGLDKCPVCAKSVYKVEAFPFQGRSWHKTCFQCGGNGELGCKRNVSSMDYCQDSGNPYCKACFQKNFTPLGTSEATAAAATAAAGEAAAAATAATAATAADVAAAAAVGELSTEES
jgi:cysteine/glycine-rich protein